MEIKGIIVSPDTQRKIRIPPGQHLTDRWPVLHFGKVHNISTEGWSLRIFGLIDQEKTLSYVDFSNLPVSKVFSDIHCVTTWSRLDNLWEGVQTQVIKSLVNIRPEARYVIIHAAGGFTTNLVMEDFFADDVIMATKWNNENISAEHGGPVRLVVPRLYFWKSAKWINGIEFSEVDRPGFWESSGYHNHGDPWTEERYGRPI